MFAHGVAVVVLAASSVAHAEATTLEKSARTIIVSQLAAASSPPAFLSTLAPDAVILGNGSFAVARGSHSAAIVGTLVRTPVVQSILVRIDVGGNEDALWLSADAAFVDGNGCGETDARFVELAVADHGTWKVVAMSFTSTSGLTAIGDEIGAPHAGPLTGYLASAYKLDEALRDNSSTTVVIGEVNRLGDLGLGRDGARHVLAPLRYRDTSVTNGIEVHGKAWGFAVGEVALTRDPQPDNSNLTHARVLLIAIQEDRRWNVVAMQLTLPQDSTAPQTLPRCAQPPLTQPSPMSNGTLPAQATIEP